MGKNVVITKNAESTTIRIWDWRQVLQVRNEVGLLAKKIGFSTVAVNCITSAVLELATNIASHATQGGTITIKAKSYGEKDGIEVIAEDEGPGIPNIGISVKDNFSSGEALGFGLSSVMQLMDDFEIQSKVDVGTKITCRKWINNR